MAVARFFEGVEYDVVAWGVEVDSAERNARNLLHENCEVTGERLMDNNMWLILGLKGFVMISGELLFWIWRYA